MLKSQKNVFGPYKLLKTIGQGEFGKVKEGVHLLTKTKVAIKFIKKLAVDSAERREKLQREITILQSIQHRFVIELFEVIETETYIGLVMEYAPGGELFEYILAREYLSEKESSRIFAQIIDAVCFMHSLKIVHRDLKLENILMDRNRNIKITDFGFANTINDFSNGLLMTSCGSPCYAAPELEYVGEIADIWSCGVILYAMLCGTLPFDDDPQNENSENMVLLYKYIMETELKFPVPLTRNAIELVNMLLERDPFKRATMKQVKDHPWMAAHHALFTTHSKTNSRDTAPVKILEITTADVALDSGMISPTGDSNYSEFSLPVQIPVTRAAINPEVVHTFPERSPKGVVSTRHVVAEAFSTPRRDSPIPDCALPIEAIESVTVPVEIINVNLAHQIEQAPVTNINEIEADTRTVITDIESIIEPLDMIHDESSDSVDLEKTPEQINHIIQERKLIECDSDCSIDHEDMKVLSMDSLDLNQEPDFTSTPTPSIRFNLSKSASKASLSSKLNRKSLMSLVLVGCVSKADERDTTTASAERARLEHEKEQEEMCDQVAELKPITAVRFDRPRTSLNLSRPNTEFREKAVRAQSLDMHIVKNSNSVLILGSSASMSRYVSPHSGPIDQRALSLLPPSVLLEKITNVLTNMGLAYTFGEDAYKLVVIKNPAQVEYDLTKRRPSIQSQSSKRSTRKPIGSSISSIFQKIRYISLFGFQYNRGYDGSTFIPPLINHNRPPVNTFVKFHVVVHRIRDLDGLYIVDLKRHKGDIWEFKRIYSEIISNLELDRD